MKGLNALFISSKFSIKQAMRVIDRNGQQVAYIIDKNKKLIGAISDGDIRSNVIKGVDINLPVIEVMNKDPLFLNEEESVDPSLSRRVIMKLVDRAPGSRVIPVVNSRGVPLYLVSCLTGRVLKTDEDDLNRPIKKVLVVGGAGFLGSVLVRKLLDNGFKVRVLDQLLFGKESLADLTQNPDFNLIKGDVRNISTLVTSLSGIECVIDLAALVGDPACATHPRDAIDTNYLATKALAEACKYYQINRFLFASTCSVYGRGDKILDENSPLAPVSLYARSKIQSEEAILSLEDGNFSPTILRLSTLYGFSPRMRYDLVVNTMVMTAFKEKKIYVHGGGLQWRPLLWVGDAASAFMKCLKAPLNMVKGEVFNVGSEGQNYQIRQIAKEVARNIKGVNIVYKGDVNDARNYFVSFKKIVKKLGFSVNGTIEKGIREIHTAINRGLCNRFMCPKYYNVPLNK